MDEPRVRRCGDQRIDPAYHARAECLRLKRRKGEGRVDARGSGDVDLGVFPANARTRWRQARLGATKTSPSPTPRISAMRLCLAATMAALAPASAQRPIAPIATSFGLAWLWNRCLT
jgi:hypothetical protein